MLCISSTCLLMQYQSRASVQADSWNTNAWAKPSWSVRKTPHEAKPSRLRASVFLPLAGPLLKSYKRLHELSPYPASRDLPKPGDSTRSYPSSSLEARTSPQASSRCRFQRSALPIYAKLLDKSLSRTRNSITELEPPRFSLPLSSSPVPPALHFVPSIITRLQ